MPSFHCLILASNADRRRAWEELLRGAGHLVVPATEPGESKEALAASELDYLVLDLRLPLIDLPNLQQAINPAEPGPPDSLEAAERRHIALTLRYTGGNRRQAARILGIARSTMLSKLRKYGLEHLHSEK